ncbi:MAG TPA: SIMPL domain-containing protein [Kiritimatiellia bacterium]|nr:SIMPL domain-containing protein [Kiritimatiellia bacterium]
MNHFRLILLTLIASAALVVSATQISKLFVRIKQERAISVKGYAEQGVRADAGTFSVTVGARGATASEALEVLKQRRDRVRETLRARGFAEAEIRVLTPSQRKVPRKDAQGRDSNEIEYFDLYQTITVESSSVERIYEAALDLPNLMSEDIDLTVSAPEFLISQMETLKRELLARATEDGFQRAMVMAQNSGGRVGELVSAQQGVFQITTPLSTETSSWGMYDTSTIEKTAKVVVTLEYAILPGAR